MAASANPAIRIAVRPALQQAIATLDSEGLPVSDLTEARIEHFFYCGRADSRLALIGVELYGMSALLRSLVVVPAARGTGLGVAMVKHAEDNARSQGARAMYLLTETAERFFAELGYERIARAKVASEIRQTTEFKDLCPRSSAVTAKTL